MLIRFTNDVLGSLRRKYQFVGGINPGNHVDAGPPVLVEDVSEQTAIAASFLITASITLDTGGAGASVYDELSRAEILALTNVQSKLAALGLSGDDIDIFVLDCWATCTQATQAELSAVRAGVRFGLPNDTGEPRMIQVYDQVGHELVSGGNFFLRSSGVPNSREGWGHVHFPFLLPNDTDSALLGSAQDVASGALSSKVFFLLLIAAEGAFSPL